MKAKRGRLTWRAVRKTFRLEREDAKLAREMFLKPEDLLRFLPDSRHTDPCTAGAWIRCLYRQEYGALPGEPYPELSEEEAARQFEEQMYWEDYRERNAE